MKRSTRLIVALGLTILLAAVSVSVWAGPGRQGSGGPGIPQGGYPGACATSANPNAEINFQLGTVRVWEADCKLIVKLVKDPSKKVAPPLTGWTFLFPYAVEVDLAGQYTSDIVGLEVCVPISPDWEGKITNQTISWYHWDETTSAWVAVPTEVKGESPEMICGTTEEFGGGFGELGTFTLQGQ